MKTITVFLFVMLASLPLFGQESDLEVKNNFERTYRSIVEAIDSAKSTAILDSLLNAISGVESQYTSRQAFLDKALYPETFTSSIAKLRSLHSLTYDRVMLIQSQGMTIVEYEERISSLSARLDSLTADRDRLFSELKASRKSLTEMREKMRILSRSLEARDRLTFALVDSIFLPYDKNLSQASEVQKEAVTRKLLKSNVVARVYDIAADNVKFLDVTQLQAKDYASLIEQQQQFKTKWTGLRDKINAVAISAEPSDNTKAATEPGKKGKGTAIKDTSTHSSVQEPATHVDAIMSEWEAKLKASFWASLNKEFSTKSVYVRPFTDAQSFAASMRLYVDSAKADGRDVFLFVNDIWKDRIDKEWREALTKDSMLGKAEYASLDKTVSELGEKKFDMKFILYVLVAAVAAFGGWWLVQRKPKSQSA